MTDRVLIPFGPEILVLTDAEFSVARDRGRAMAMPSLQPSAALAPSGELVNAKTLAAQLSLPVSCLYEYAKAGRIPCVRVGKHVRFDVALVRGALGGTTVGRA